MKVLFRGHSLLLSVLLVGCGGSDDSTDDVGSPDDATTTAVSNASDASADDSDEPPGECVECGCPDGGVGIECPESPGTCMFCSDPEETTGSSFETEEGNCLVEVAVSGEISEQFVEDSCGGNAFPPSYLMSYGAAGADAHLGINMEADSEVDPETGPFEREARVTYRTDVQGVAVEWIFFDCTGSFEITSGIPTEYAGVQTEATRVEGSIDCTGIEPQIDGYAGAQVPDGTGPVTLEPFDFVWWDITPN